MPELPSPLYWFPFPVDRWLGDLAGGLRADQKGALLDLLATAWSQQPPCTLPADPTYLASRSGLGAAWRKLSPPLMKHFEPTGDDRVICPWLRAIYDEQLTKYENRSRANRGNRRGTKDQTDGETKPPTNAPTNPPTIPLTIEPTNGETNGPRFEPQNLELEGQSPELLQSSGAIAPAQERALGVETPRAASAMDPQAEASRLLEQAYFQRLRRRVDSFAKAHPERYAEIQDRVREEQGFPRGRPLLGWVLSTYNDAVLLAVRELHPDWPQSAEDWRRQLGDQSPTDEEPPQEASA